MILDTFVRIAVYSTSNIREQGSQNANLPTCPAFPFLIQGTCVAQTAYQETNHG
jgi:hypothetical protein